MINFPHFYFNFILYNLKHFVLKILGSFVIPPLSQKLSLKILRELVKGSKTTTLKQNSPPFLCILYILERLHKNGGEFSIKEPSIEIFCVAKRFQKPMTNFPHFF